MNIRIPVSWLRDYLKTDAAAKTIANLLTAGGPSVENTTKHGEDYIFDIEVTTNRFDTLSVFGIAREANAILNMQGYKSNLNLPKGVSLNLEPDTSNRLILDVVIKNPNLCPRFTAIVLDNIKVKPSPAYIRNRLGSSGIRQINNIVDISNFVMLELGQPMHTFDFDKIIDSKMILRKSKEGEKITTLDSKIRKLPEGTIVIQDSKRLIDLCGIMGAENSRVTRRTKRVVLFVQSYNSQTIRKTTQKLAFRTEAASRFEKDIDLEGILPALSRAVYLLKQTANAKIASELVDIYPKKQTFQKISLDTKKLNKYLGIKFEQSLASQILTLLGFKVITLKPTRLNAQIPSWRARDIEGDIDLIEEIARVWGYHNLPSKLPEGQIPQTRDNELKEVIKLKTALKYLGLTEVITYSIVSKELLKLSQVSRKHAVELNNPLGDQWQFMRPSLIPSLLEVLAKNINVKKYLKIFEIARTYVNQNGDLPRQDLILTVVINNVNFSQIKGYVENILEILERGVKWQKLFKDSPLFDKDQSSQISISSQIVGTIGLLKRDLCDFFQVGSNVQAAQINLSSICSLPKITHAYKPIPKYPPVIEDISAIFSNATPIDEILGTIQKTSSLVKKIELIDIFTGRQIGESQKSATFRLTYQKSISTPTQEEVDIEKAKIITSLKKEFRARIRK
ncbi:phenylalanine--tRNA ligase subunit beta [Candidatus Curtissbacteria bacterium RIFCSPLOWO2_01_FULL_38_11b]|uniref:Phenylalanine--tRNA ligase beta subunit n=1 Tax=Candidatus Curtissbacteria bacterium RIFCSPLOWO2_01_FULL_38_11b TaxID=1797725 RepID=A0A1F5H1E5_9BACT|nr:MAG: phenylalanine--tRNA ligase subunit beta [Candidatus Curtissbacteria bacterium RIFCSPLOWO2_01_FULL_38_11b]